MPELGLHKVAPPTPPHEHVWRREAQEGLFLPEDYLLMGDSERGGITALLVPTSDLTRLHCVVPIQWSPRWSCFS